MRKDEGEGKVRVRRFRKREDRGEVKRRRREG